MSIRERLSLKIQQKYHNPKKQLTLCCIVLKSATSLNDWTRILHEVTKGWLWILYINFWMNICRKSYWCISYLWSWCTFYIFICVITKFIHQSLTLNWFKYLWPIILVLYFFNYQFETQLDDIFCNKSLNSIKVSI